MGILEVIAGAVVFFVILAIGAYIALAIVLNSLNKKMFGKGTALAWIPICNIYLLGKLTVNKIMGWILIALIFLTATFTTTINGLTRTYSILPDGVKSIVLGIYNIVVLVLFIYAIVKNVQLKKSLNNGQTNQSFSNDTNMNVNPQMETPVQSEPAAPQMEIPVQSEPAVGPTTTQQQNAFNIKPENVSNNQ